MNDIRILRAQFEAEQHMAWQALHIPPCSAALANASSVSAPASAPAVAVQAAAYSGDPGQIPSLPIAPAPGTPAYPGDESQIPSLPIAPAPGIPAYPGDESQIPSLPIAPEPGIPAYPGDESQIPSLPIAPAPGTPAYPGNGSQPSVRPTPRTCWVRFLHAAYGYDPLRVLVGSNVFTPSLSYANMTEYRLVREGSRAITITSASGGRPVLLRKNLHFRAGELVTVAILDGENGLELMPLPDSLCKNQLGGCGAMRMVNLAYGSPPLDMRLYDGTIVFSDVRYREVTPFRPVRCGDYFFYLIRTAPAAGTNLQDPALPYEPLVSFEINVRLHASYTCYVLGRVGVPGQILQMLVAEDE